MGAIFSTCQSRESKKHFWPEYLQGCPKFCSLFYRDPQSLSKTRTCRIRAVFLSLCFPCTSSCKQRLKRKDFVCCELCVSSLLHWHTPQTKKSQLARVCIWFLVPAFFLRVTEGPQPESGWTFIFILLWFPNLLPKFHLAFQ